MLREHRGETRLVANMVALKHNTAFVLALGFVEFTTFDACEAKDTSEMDRIVLAASTFRDNRLFFDSVLQPRIEPAELIPFFV